MVAIAATGFAAAPSFAAWNPSVNDPIWTPAGGAPSPTVLVYPATSSTSEPVKFRFKFDGTMFNHFKAGYPASTGSSDPAVNAAGNFCGTGPCFAVESLLVGSSTPSENGWSIKSVEKIDLAYDNTHNYQPFDIEITAVPGPGTTATSFVRMVSLPNILYSTFGNGPNGSPFSRPFSDYSGYVYGIISDPVSPPATPVLSGAPSSLTNQTSASISFSSEGADSYTCSVDGGAFAACTSPKSLTGLSDGAHSLSVKAVNTGGESSAATANWTVDATAPAAPTITSAPAATTTSTSASIAFTGESGATFSCSIDNGAFATCTSPRALSGLAIGAHSFRVRATDAAGNTGAVATANWTVQAVPTGPISPPTTPTTAPAKTVVYNTATKRWTMKLGLIFTTGGDPRGAAQLMTVQFSTNQTRPSNTQPIPTRPSAADGIRSFASEVYVSSARRPAWVRVGNRAGKWTGWVQLRP